LALDFNILVPIMKPRSTFEYAIDVFRRDRDRAEAAIPKTKNDDDFDDKDG
jgi:hypothetical protein